MVPRPLRRSRLVACFLVFGAVSSWDREARAQAGPFPGGGFSLHNFEPAAAGDRFFLVPDGASDPDPRDPGQLPIRAQLLGHYALTPPLTRTDLVTGTTEDVIERQLFAHANVTVIAAPWLLLNADLPVAALQEGASVNSPGSSIGDLRLGARFGLFGKRTSAFSLGAGIHGWLPTGSPESVTGDGALRGEPFVAVSGKLGVFIYAAKVGYLIRNAVSSGAQSAEVGSSLTAGGALGLSLFDDVLSFGPELSGAFLTDSSTNRAFSMAVSPLHALFGARVQLGDFQLGAGYSLPVVAEPAPGEAQRVLATFAFSPPSRTGAEVARTTRKEEPKDSDGDGIADLDDACPAEAGFESRDPRNNGCLRAQGPIDTDKDGVTDEVDACPEVVGDSSPDPAKNGCPRPKVVEKVIAPATPPPAPVVKEVCVVQKDRDGDGVEDALDQCPEEPGSRELRGCPKNVKGKPLVPRKGKPTVTFVGFRKLEDEKVLVYVELTHAVRIEQSQSGEELTFQLPGTVILFRNNKNPLLATHFESIVTEARLTEDSRATELHLKLRQDVETTARVVDSVDGAVLEVEVRPKGR